MELITHLTQEIKQLEKADYCWLSATKLATIQQLMLAHPAGLRDRKSGLHLSASAMVLIGSKEFLFGIRTCTRFCCRQAMSNLASCQLSAPCVSFMKKLDSWFKQAPGN